MRKIEINLEMEMFWRKKWMFEIWVICSEKKIWLPFINYVTFMSAEG